MLVLGSVVTANTNRVYRVVKQLGEGITSRVYLAQDVETLEQVALKALRQGVPEIVIASFWQEGDVLGALHRAEEYAGDGIHSVPRVLGFKREGEPRFIVLELVHGEPLDKVLDVRAILAEREALTIADQFLRVLNLLHTQLRQSYTDMQLQNIWLLQGLPGESAAIKIMDWNHVSEKPNGRQELGTDLVQADLRRFGAYLYRMCIGKGASSRGETERDLCIRAGEHWNHISPSTRQILVRALHPSDDQMFSTTTEFRDAVQEHLSEWDTDWAEHLGNVQDWLSESAFDNRTAARVQNALFIAERAGADHDKIEYYKKRLEERTGPISPQWEAGKKFYETGHYATAAEKWEQEAESLGRIELWRWVAAANAGVELGEAFSEVRPQIEQMIAAVEHGSLATAEQAIQELKSQTTRRVSIQVLEKEIEARVLVITARTFTESDDPQLWRDALKTFEKANRLVEKHPYGALLRQEEGWGQFEKEIIALRDKIYTRQKSDKLLPTLRGKIFAPTTFELGLADLRIQLHADPTNSKLVEFCRECGEEYLQKQDAYKALQLLKIGLMESQVSPLDKPLRLAHQEARVQLEQQRLAAASSEQQAVVQARTTAEQEQAKQAEKKKTFAADQERRQKIAAHLRAAESAFQERNYESLLKHLEQVPYRGLQTKDEQDRWQALGHRVWKTFEKAKENKNLSMMQSFRDVLDFMDPDQARMTERNKTYQRIANELARDSQNWAAAFLHSILERRSQYPPQKYAELRDEIETNLLWIQDEKIRAELSRQRDELNAFRNEPQALIELGQFPEHTDRAERDSNPARSRGDSIGFLDQKVRELETDLKTLREEKEKRHIEKSRLGEVNQDLERQLVEMRGKTEETVPAEQPESRLPDAQAEIQNLRAELENLNEANGKLTGDTLDLEKVRAELNAERDRNSTQVASIRGGAEEQRKKLEDQIRQVDQRHSEIESKLQEANQNRDAALGRAQLAEQRAAQLEKERNELQSQFELQQREIERLKQVPSATLTQTGDPSQRIKAALVDIQALTSERINGAGRELKEIEQRLPNNSSLYPTVKNAIVMIELLKDPRRIDPRVIIDRRAKQNDFPQLLKETWSHKPTQKYFLDNAVIKWVADGNLRYEQAQNEYASQQFGQAWDSIRSAIVNCQAAKIVMGDFWETWLRGKELATERPSTPQLDQRLKVAQELFEMIKRLR